MNYRKIEMLENEEWKEVQFQELKSGNVFRMFEPDGKPVVGAIDEFEGTTSWKVIRDPYLNEDNVLTVDCGLVDKDEI